MTSTIASGASIIGVDILGPATTDASRLIAFYRDVLGMTPTKVQESGAEFELPDGATFGVYAPEDASPGQGYGALFAVGDIDAAVARFRANGAQLSDPMETPVCFIAFGQDPDGNSFGIHQRKHAN
ncbi:VOC family protein [bacterium]|nr:MAG: VOC family protein [bacterium]